LRRAALPCLKNRPDGSLAVHEASMTPVSALTANPPRDALLAERGFSGAVDELMKPADCPICGAVLV
jgi:hypothetical protein